MVLYQYIYKEINPLLTLNSLKDRYVLMTIFFVLESS